jgi:hypothetical protein
MTGKEIREDGEGRTTMVGPLDACGPTHPSRGGPHAFFEPHGVELDVRRRLLAHPRLHFSSLVVRRLRDGVCLEGVVETDAELDDVDQFVGAVSGVSTILNRLVLQRPPAPPKG